MQGMGGHGQIASGQFMRTLGAGFYPLQSLRDGEIDGLIIAQLKMQAGEILGAAPIAAKKRVLADKIQSPRDITPVAFGPLY